MANIRQGIFVSPNGTIEGMYAYIVVNKLEYIWHIP